MQVVPAPAIKSSAATGVVDAVYRQPEAGTEGVHQVALQCVNRVLLARSAEKIIVVGKDGRSQSQFCIEFAKGPGGADFPL